MYDAGTLRRLQLTQLEMLKELHKICEEHDIRYSLYGGTLLGAVRHKGFIPWDDDLDVCMTRQDFLRFVQAWETRQPTGYYLQNIEKDEDFTQTFAKIRKKNTAFVQGIDVGFSYDKGIFIDIFILDKVPNGRVRTFFQRLCGYLNLLYSRKFPPYNNGLLMRALCTFLLKIVPRDRYRAIRGFCVKQLGVYNGNECDYYVDSSTFEELRRYIPKSVVENTVLLEFEGEYFPCFKDWHTYLERTYGDYMSLPPEEKRVMTHSPICIDFERTYEDIIATSNNASCDMASADLHKRRVV